MNYNDEDLAATIDKLVSYRKTSTEEFKKIYEEGVVSLASFLEHQESMLKLYENALEECSRRIKIRGAGLKLQKDVT